MSKKANRRITGHGQYRLALSEWNRAALKKRNGQTVLLVHGYPDNRAVWDSVAKLLAQHFHVVSYDVRGAGQSDVPRKKRDYRLDVLRQDLLAVIKATSSDKPVHLVGHDWGSIQSWEAVTAADARNHIASFTSISRPCLDHIGYRLRAELGDRSLHGLTTAGLQVLRSWYVFAMQLPLLAPTVWRLGLDKQWPSLLKRLESKDGLASVISPSQRRDGIHGVNLYRANVMPRLLRPRERYTNVPVQLIVPTQDPFVGLDLYKGLDQWVTELHRVDVAAGHWLPLSDPQTVATHVAEFISQTSAVQSKAA